MRYIYLENEQMDRSPARKNGDPIVIINRYTHMPEIGIWSDTLGVLIIEKNVHWRVSPDYWEIAWP